MGAPILAKDGSIIVTAGDELVVLLGTSPPAFSGWPMTRHDARGTGGQGTDGPRTLGLSFRTDGGIQLESPNGAPFLPLVSTDLLQWHPASGVFETETTSPGQTRVGFVPALPESVHFFRAVAP